ncbi:uncharacterized protein PV06_04640 [Exophiala oligosperma]|uniref:Prenylcysteine lyase domain-containing protein n=2 Tax=Chaetothyriales TaxID=34395 RepID=A0A0D2E6Y4_9EURO|nr:uncharacterized protein PV06_04640 [Exophiala oligosperma]KAJ9620660.1 hypothetical protein H2204_012215 [Knufia peltigerae]KIW43549.1 hypothetical protein PV06_04640 [Exophiala oligosperma]
MHVSILSRVLILFLLHVLPIATEHVLPPQRPLQKSDTAATVKKTHRVAIIGAGPGGSSASYHLDKFSRLSSLDTPLDITIFDTNPYIGGRTTTVNALEDPRYPVELGASIFVEINHILYNATRDFDLTPSLKIYQATPTAKYELGIWDGVEFVFKTVREDDDGGSSSWRGWWDIAKLLWKYGLSPIRTQRATKAAISSFLRFYDDYFPFTSLQDAVMKTGLDTYTGATGKEVLENAGVGGRFAREIIQASTRVNYASNLGGIHGLETLVCMAIEGAMAVHGGNWQIFDTMVKNSAQRAFLNTSVTHVERTSKGTYLLQTDNEELKSAGTGEQEVDFDTVILAAPYQFANISFTPQLLSPPDKIPYVSLYVTLFTSPHRPMPAFFGLGDDEQDDVPSSIITTLPEDLNERLGSRHGVEAVGPSGFWSISTLKVLHPESDGRFAGPMSEFDSSTEETEESTQYLYKIFSPAPLTGSFLSELLGFEYRPPSDDDEEDSLGSLPKKDVSWFYEKMWHSYPYELPRTAFVNFTLQMDEDQDRGLYYLSGMESFISTMETSALAGMNVAKLIVEGLKTRES